LSVVALLAAASFGTILSAQSPSPTAGASARRSAALLPGTTASAFGLIRGTALDTDGRALVDAIVRLRDARHGRILGTRTTDRAGLFEFRAVDAGLYVVELVGQRDHVLAASDLLIVRAGDTITAVVQLPFRISPLAALLGESVPHVATVLGAAAAAGVLATGITGEDISPQ
jgi:hypothetical protein